MRKKIKSCSGQKPDGAMPGVPAAPAFLMLPRLSADIPMQLEDNDGDILCGQILAVLSNCIDIKRHSPYLQHHFNPPKTLPELLVVIMSMTLNYGPGYRYIEKVFKPKITIYHPDKAYEEFCDLCTHSTNPAVFIEVEGDSSIDYNAGYLREVERMTKGKGQAILEVLDDSPIFIATPRTILSEVSMYYWNGSNDESDRMEELQLENEDQDNDYYEDMIPIMRADFKEAYPDWTLTNDISTYTGPLPAAAERLKAVNKQYYSLQDKYKYHFERLMGNMPAVHVTGLAEEPIQAEAIFNKYFDDQMEDQYNSSGRSYLTSVMTYINLDGKYQGTLALLEMLRAYLDCMDATAELLCYLQETQERITVTA